MGQGRPLASVPCVYVGTCGRHMSATRLEYSTRARTSIEQREERRGMTSNGGSVQSSLTMAIARVRIGSRGQKSR